MSVTITSNLKCDECGEAAILGVLKDPFGQVDSFRHLCPKHAPRGFAGYVLASDFDALQARYDALQADQSLLCKEMDTLQARYDAMEAELASARKTNHDWLHENAPGGWIDDQRSLVTRAREVCREYLDINDTPPEISMTRMLEIFGEQP